MMHRFNTAPQYARLFALLLLVIAAIGWAPLAAAAPNCKASSATLSFPTTVTIPSNTAVGSTLATGTANMTFTCTGLSSSNTPATIQAGQTLAPLDPTNNVNGPGITFATGVSGLAVLVTATPVQATSNSCLACGPTSTAGYVLGSVTGNSGTVTANYTATLIKTGPIAPGTIPSTNLIPFWWYIPGNGNGYSTSMSLNANLVLPAINLTAPSCTLTTGSQNIAVKLPTVASSSLATAGQVAGATAFSISITGCPTSVTKLTTFFNSGGNIDTTSGNLLNNGSAANIEVQLLNGPGGSAAAYSVINLTGAQASAQNSSQYSLVGTGATLNYYAQYIAYGGAAGAGTVNTSVTFTIAYP
ncbi:MAG: hypothetical protein WA777_11390 [Rhodanobacter sp.]